MNKIAALRGQGGHTTLLGYDFNSSFEALAERGEVDCFIVSSEDGFSPLGSARRFFSHDLGIDEKQISDVANWNRFECPTASLVVLPSLTAAGKLRGVVLAASESSKCYEQFAVPRYGKPYRDFYYNVAYESIVLATRHLKAKRLAISHLSVSGSFHEDIATCVAEALAHYCDEPAEPRIDSFLFVGCCMQPYHFHGITRLNAEGNLARHTAIPKTTALRSGFEVVSLDLQREIHP